jgi:exosortase A-associated hydrolase 1
MNFTEEVTLFECAADTLVGILARPEKPARTGLVVIVGGPQYRTGSHRQFVLLSRSLAAAGYAVLRFDYRGMGDSTGESRDFLTIKDDIEAAINALQQSIPSIKRVSLWGLCDGASAALLYCGQTHDPRVSGLCLLNPWVRSEVSLARTHIKHYYAQRLLQKEFWRKLVNGEISLGAINDLSQSIRLSASGSGWLNSSEQPFQNHMAMAWNRFHGKILLILSTGDLVAKEFREVAQTDPAWRGALARGNLQRHELNDVDHTFSSAASRKLAETSSIDWLEHTYGTTDTVMPQC